LKNQASSGKKVGLKPSVFEGLNIHRPMPSVPSWKKGTLSHSLVQNLEREGYSVQAAISLYREGILFPSMKGTWSGGRNLAPHEQGGFLLSRGRKRPALLSIAKPLYRTRRGGFSSYIEGKSGHSDL